MNVLEGGTQEEVISSPIELLAQVLDHARRPRQHQDTVKLTSFGRNFSELWR